jgi:hypothetical protein
MHGMVYSALGATDIYTSLLSIGSQTNGKYGTPSGLSLEGQARPDRLLRRAFDLGCNLLDVYLKQLEAASRPAQVFPSLIRSRATD